MENIQVKIESPVKYYDFVDQHGDLMATFRFVPSDLDIFDRHKEVYQEFEKMQDELKKLSESGEISDDAAIEIKNKYATSLKEKFNYLFNADTSGFFAVASPFTPLDNGEPWAVVILKNVLQIIEKETGKNFKEMKSNADKYTKRYQAAPGKNLFPVK